MDEILLTSHSTPKCQKSESSIKGNKGGGGTIMLAQGATFLFSAFATYWLVVLKKTVNGSALCDTAKLGPQYQCRI